MTKQEKYHIERCRYVGETVEDARKRIESKKLAKINKRNIINKT